MVDEHLKQKLNPIKIDGESVTVIEEAGYPHVMIGNRISLSPYEVGKLKDWLETFLKVYHL